MADFGAPRYGKSTKGRPCILYQSQDADQAVENVANKKVRKFSPHNKPLQDGRQAYRCADCACLKAANKEHPPIPMIYVKDDRIITDPDKISHYCIPQKKYLVEFNQISVESRFVDVRKNAMMAKRAHAVSATKAVDIEDPDGSLQPAIAGVFRDYHQDRRALSKHRKAKFPPCTIDTIPASHKVIYTARKNPVPTPETQIVFFTDDPIFAEPIPAYNARNAEGQRSPILLCTSRKDIVAWQQSAHFIADGTFQYKIKSYGQLFSLHGNFKGEWMPFIQAHLPNKELDTYVAFFTMIRRLVTKWCGGIGGLANTSFHSDFEVGIISAWKQVWPEIRSFCCYFHLKKNNKEHMGSKEFGLKHVFENKGKYAGAEFAVFGEWVRKLWALAFVPPYLVRDYYDRNLSQPPRTGNATVDANIAKWHRYFYKYYLKELPLIERWNHWANWDGPRTDNPVEGWNNGLKFTFDSKQMKVGEYLEQMIVQHNAHLIRLQHLIDGAQPRPRAQRCIDKDIAIGAAKMRFHEFHERYIAYAEPIWPPAPNVDTSIYTYAVARLQCMDVAITNHIAEIMNIQ